MNAFHFFIPITGYINHNIRLNIIILYKMQHQIWPPWLLLLIALIKGFDLS